jgi:hypothetical protein
LFRYGHEAHVRVMQKVSHIVARGAYCAIVQKDNDQLRVYACLRT